MINESDSMVTGSTEQEQAAESAIKAKAKEAGAAAMEATRAAYEQMQNKAQECLETTDKAIRKNPYTALGIALGAGLLLGLLMNRRGRSE